MDTIKPGEITFDLAKNDTNIRERGLPFSLVRDDALGFIGGRLHAVVFTRRATVMHVISLRKANRREERRYATQTESATD